MTSRPKLLFITNTPAFYKAPAFRLLSQKVPTHFLFFSRGNERYRSQSSDPLFDGLSYQDLGTSAWSRYQLLIRLIGAIWRSDYDVMVKCINGKLELPTSYVLCRLLRRRFVLWTGLWHSPRSCVHLLGRPFLRYMLRHADAVCTYGNHVCRFLVREGVSAKRLVPVSQAVDPEAFRYREPLAMDEESEFKVLFVGRLEQEKGLDVLLQALSLLGGRTILYVVGQGSLEPTLRALAGRLSVAVEWLGSLQRQDLATLYHQSNVLVIPSRTTRMDKEPWGYVANEAMLSGCPVIASTAVGAAAGGLIVDASTGLIFDEGNYRQLAGQLERIRKDPNLGADLSAKARLAAERYTPAAMADGFLEAIDLVFNSQAD